MGPLGYITVLTIPNSIRSRIPKLALLSLLLCVAVFLLLTLIYGNIIFLRTAGLLVGIFAAYVIIRRTNRKELSLLIDVFFWASVFFIFLDYVFYTLGISISSSSGRFGGLLGYDFVPFIMATYIVHLLSGSQSVNGYRRAVILIAIATILVSGRFGIVVLGLLFLFMALEKPRASIWMPMLFLIPPVLFLFRNQLMFTFTTLELVVMNLQTETTDFSKLVEFGFKGYYNASPLTWAHEVSSVFKSETSLWLPKATHVGVDSGPAYLTANGGILLALFYYCVTLLFFWPSNLKKLSLLAILFLTDLKFRCLLSALPSIWLLILYETSRRPLDERISIK